MELHQRQHLDLLLQMAVERLTERAVQRCQGAENALGQLRDDPDGEGVWLGDFLQAFFQDACLDNTAGAAFVLQALEKRPAPPVAAGGVVGDALQEMARHVFRDLLARKVEESLSQQLAYGA
jgi:hypothetical protein